MSCNCGYCDSHAPKKSVWGKIFTLLVALLGIAVALVSVNLQIVVVNGKQVVISFDKVKFFSNGDDASPKETEVYSANSEQQVVIVDTPGSEQETTSETVVVSSSKATSTLIIHQVKVEPAYVRVKEIKSLARDGRYFGLIDYARNDKHPGVRIEAITALSEFMYISEVSDCLFDIREDKKNATKVRNAAQEIIILNGGS